MSASMGELALDRPLPQSTDAERAVLGSIILERTAFDRVIGIIDSEDFFRDAHRTIFATMRYLAEESREIDHLTLREELAKKGQLDQIGGSAYVASLIDGIPDIANVERYAKIVKEKSTLRRLIVMGNSVMRAALDAPSEPAEVVSDAERTLYSIAEGSTERGFVEIPAVMKSNIASIEALSDPNRRYVTGIATGYSSFDRFTSGFQPQDLIIIAARPSMGKTSLLSDLACAMSVPGFEGQPRHAGERLYSVGFFSLEMSKEQIGLRVLSSESGVPNTFLREGIRSEKNWRAIAVASSRIAKAKIAIDDTPALDLMEMRARARRLQRERGLDIILVDYLQLMTVRGRHENRNVEVSRISAGLKAIAKELRVPVVALAQLSRRPEQRTGDHRPQLADLRDSGSIEQDADVVTFIYRDEVYNKESPDKGIAEIIVAKNRNGPIGDFKLVFIPDTTSFREMAPATWEEPAA